jgi:hypothetical protein
LPADKLFRLCNKYRFRLRIKRLKRDDKQRVSIFRTLLFVERINQYSQWRSSPDESGERTGDLDEHPYFRERRNSALLELTWSSG